VYAAVYRYLEGPSGWAALSDADIAVLRSLPIVPVGSTLLPPYRVFFRVTEPLAPLIAEVPRAFGSYETTLTRLGVAETPSRSHYLRFLEEYAHAGASSVPLNVNELK